MRKILAGSILALMPTLVLAGGHSGLGGTGTGITVEGFSPNAPQNMPFDKNNTARTIEFLVFMTFKSLPS